MKYDVPVSGSVNAMSFTATGNALIAFDEMATMFICKLSPITDPGMHLNIYFKLFV